MNSYEIKVWNEQWNMEVTEYVRVIDGVDLHDAHVELLKQGYYSYISDASKDATGRRARYDVSEMTVAELIAECDMWSDRVGESIKEDEAREAHAVEVFEATVASHIEVGAGDRETAIRWIREAHDDDYGDESIKYNLGLPYSYDLDHGDRDFFKRQVANAA